ncbi:MAG: T9SS type A sorting domain-containing protein [Candidatus Zixiibacteriota bacterium]
MRCRQARKKLIELVLARVPLDRDGELMEHLSKCPACAAQAEAAVALNSDFESARGHDNSDSISWPTLKSKVEARVMTQINERKKEKSIMAGIYYRARRRPRFSIGVAAFAIVIMLSLIIPIRYDKTVGYEVAFAGVDKNLAMDGDKIALLLDKLGVDDAEVDVTDCDTTCKVFIKKLRSADDADLVIAAFSDIDNVELLEDVKPIRESSLGNIIKVVTSTISISERHRQSMQEAKKIIWEKLGDSVDCNEFIWMATGDDSGSIVQIDMQSCVDQAGDRHNILYISENESVFTEDGVAKLAVNCLDPSKDRDIICIPPDGKIDDSTLSMLRSKGLTVIFRDSADIDYDNLEEWVEKNEDGDNDDYIGKEASVIPDKFVLSQNYPNPFNPDTRIDYYIPTSQHVTLDIINTNGRLVRTLVDNYQESGWHYVEWDATDENDNKVATGVYLYRIKAGDFSETKKMSFVK